MRKILGLAIGLFKLSFLAIIFLWTTVMNFIGFMVCAISSQG